MRGYEGVGWVEQPASDEAVAKDASWRLGRGLLALRIYVLAESVELGRGLLALRI